MKFLRRLQSLPESRRKVIFWGTLGVVAVGLLIWWISRILDVVDRI